MATEVFPTQIHLGSYTPDASDSDDYVTTLHYISDTDTDGCSGNHASPLVLGSTTISIRDFCKTPTDDPPSPATTVARSSSFSSSGATTRGRWGEIGPHSRSRSISLIRRNSSFNRSNHHDQDREASVQLSGLVALVLASVRRSVVTLCRAVEEGDECSLEIGWPTDVQHVTHVTFDRYNGFLGLPQEFQVEVPGRVPSASQSVFGVSAESMQCSYDLNGNSVPTILLLMQERLYHQGGLKAEGIFRINAENSHHEHVRDQLNKGIVPMDIDSYCLAGLIKAWFRELPQGVLDELTPEQVLECHTEEDTVALVKLLPPTQAALLDWAVNLMADVVQEEVVNKMNARNIAMVFAPNMTQMADPFTALMHAVQVMNLLKTLILRTLKDRQEFVLGQSQRETLPGASEGDEPDSACSTNVIGEGGCCDSEATAETPEAEFSKQIVILPPPKHVVAEVKVRSGSLVNTIDHNNQRVEAW